MADGLRVLVLDDNQDCADSLAALLGCWGHQVCVAYDGQSALEQARIHCPSVALLDLGVRGMDSFAVAKRLQSETKGIVLIAITGSGDPESRQHSVACGFAHHLIKPVDLNQLC